MPNDVNVPATVQVVVALWPGGDDQVTMAVDLDSLIEKDIARGVKRGLPIRDVLFAAAVRQVAARRR